MIEQRIMTIEEVAGLNPAATAIWTSPSVRNRVERGLPFPILQSLQPVPTAVNTLVVVGGGTLLDEAKVWRLEQSPRLELVAVPSIWGSGAEASPIAVRNRSGKKEVRMDPKLRPEARAIWPDLAKSIPVLRVHYACGDCLAHALEGFLSPLASETLRGGLAVLIRRMLATPIVNNPTWFELSAQACAGQAQAGVGLVHGIAHTLEGILHVRQPDVEWGHARLCSLFLWPVMRFNAHASDKWLHTLARYDLQPDVIQDVTHSLYDDEAFNQVLPVLNENWMSILRDPCTRMNSALVRPGSLEYFKNKTFQ